MTDYFYSNWRHLIPDKPSRCSIVSSVTAGAKSLQSSVTHHIIEADGMRRSIAVAHVSILGTLRSERSVGRDSSASPKLN